MTGELLVLVRWSHGGEQRRSQTGQEIVEVNHSESSIAASPPTAVWVPSVPPTMVLLSPQVQYAS
jgi:hypothetical protein